jgi:RimJ/RimL family protein N-acetyltransferase
MTRDDIRTGTPVVTERLILRPYRDEDLPHLVALNADPEVMRYLGGTRTAAQSEAIAARINAKLASDGFGMAAVERRADGQFLGMCGMSPEIWYPDVLELGWRLARPFWGFGYASEAGRAWQRIAFEIFGEPRLISIADAPNAQSIAVMKRLGFTFDHAAELDDNGELFPAVIYSITRETWRAQAG